MCYRVRVVSEKGTFNHKGSRTNPEFKIIYPVSFPEMFNIFKIYPAPVPVLQQVVAGIEDVFPGWVEVFFRVYRAWGYSPVTDCEDASAEKSWLRGKDIRD